MKTLDDPLPTRASLLARVGSGDDPAGWEEFFATYRGLIHGFARKCQLSDEEAKDVVQTTMQSLVGALPDFRYDPATCRFKSWLLNVAKSRISDVQRRRLRNPAEPGTHRTEDVEQSPLEGLPGDGLSDFEALWDEEWQRHLLQAASERLKRTVQPLHFQIFHLSVIKERPKREVAETLGVNVGQVYLVSHRLKKLYRNILETVRQAEEG